MKKIILCLAAVAAFTACTKDDTTTPADGNKDLVLTFEAGTSATEEEVGKASRAGYDGLKSIWHAGDEVGLTIDANNINLHFTQESGSLASDGTRVRYTGSVNNSVSGNVTATAYFPYNAGTSVSGQTITTSFPATQPYVASGYKGLPLFAKYTGDYSALSLQFKNLFSVVKLTLNKGVSLPATVNLQKIYFKGNNNENISGAMVVDMSGATPVVSHTGTGKTVMLDLGAGVELTTVPKTFYIAVPAINYANGYSFTFITDQGQVTKSAKNTGANYAVNKIYAAPALTINSLSLVSIPDPNLRNVLEQLGLISILDPLNGLVSITTAGLQAVSLDISGKNIADLTGLSNFPALVTLKAGNNNLVSVDLSKLTLLTNLDLSANQLTSLNLAANTALLSLNLSGNQLTGLNLAANVALLDLDVSSNALTSLDLHNNILLTSLKVYGNPLVTLNISGLTLMTSLFLDSANPATNAISGLTLTIPANATVQNLIATAMTVSPWTAFVCLNNPTIQSIDLSGNVKLLSANVSGNVNLSSLNFSGNLLQTTLRTSGSTLATLNISGMPVLATLYLNTGSTNCINLGTLTVPANATVQNLIADGALVGLVWTRFVCASNPVVKTISLKNIIGLLHVTTTNNTLLTSLNVTGSSITSLTLTQSGNAAGFSVTGLIL